APRRDRHARSLYPPAPGRAGEGYRPPREEARRAPGSRALPGEPQDPAEHELVAEQLPSDGEGSGPLYAQDAPPRRRRSWSRRRRGGRDHVAGRADPRGAGGERRDDARRGELALWLGSRSAGDKA